MVSFRRAVSGSSPEYRSSVRAPKFNCIVRTTKIDDTWQTLIVREAPRSETTHPASFCLFHPAQFDDHDAAILNKLVGFGLDSFGEAGIGLLEAGEFVGWNLVHRGLVSDFLSPITIAQVKGRTRISGFRGASMRMKRGSKQRDPV